MKWDHTNTQLYPSPDDMDGNYTALRDDDYVDIEDLIAHGIDVEELMEYDKLLQWWDPSDDTIFAAFSYNSVVGYAFCISKSAPPPDGYSTERALREFAVVANDWGYQHVYVETMKGIRAYDNRDPNYDWNELWDSWTGRVAWHWSDWYVNWDIGDDSNDGTSRTDLGGGVGPWKTNDAVEQNTWQYSAGDTIWWEDDVSWMSDTSENSLNIDKSGSTGEANHIHFSGTNDGTNRPILNLNIETYGYDYLTFEHLKLDATGLTGGSASNAIFPDSGSSRVYEHTYNDIECVNGFGRGFLGYSVESIIINDCVFTGCSNGLSILGSSTVGNRPSDITISNSTFTPGASSTDGVSIHEGAGGHSDIAGSNFYIYGNTVTGSWGEDCFDITSGDHIYMWNNYIEGGTSAGMYIGDTAYQVYVYENHFYNAGEGSGGDALVTDVKQVYIYNNFIHKYNSAGYNVYIDGSNYYAADDIEVLYNTIIMPASATAGFNLVDGLNTMANVWVRNNVITTSSSSSPTMIIFGTNVTYNDGKSNWEYNLFYNPAGDPAFSGCTWTEFVTQYPTNDKVDPGLVDRTDPSSVNNLKIASTSSNAYNFASAITTGTYYYDDGTDTPASMTGITVDYWGTTRATDAGAHELVTGGGFSGKFQGVSVSKVLGVSPSNVLGV